MDALQQVKHYTYADYLTWGDEVRCELIDGVPFLLAAPTPEHQAISMELSGQLWQFLKGKPCKVYTAPFDVRLNAAEGDDTVVQPDISVICDQVKTDNNKGCVGVPDMVVEILSPSTAGKDCIIKLRKYLRAGVREYWLVDPDSRIVNTHVLKEGQYVINVYTNGDAIPVFVLDGLTINISDIFA